MFTKSRIAKLRVLVKYETNSIRTKNGAIINGVPDGKKSVKNLNLFKYIPVKFIPTCNIIDNDNVIINELVIVNEYGIKPKKLQLNINKNTK